MSKIVLIEWVDSCRLSGGVWKEGDRLRKVEPCSLTSIGYLVNETPKAVTIAGHHDADNDVFSGDLCIPRGAIKKMRRVKV